MEGGQRPRTSAADGGPPWRPARFASVVVEELAEADHQRRTRRGRRPADRARALRAVRLQPHGHPRGAEAARGARARARRAGARHDRPAAERVEPARPGRAPHRARARPRHVAARRPDRRPSACSSARWPRPRPARLTEDELAALAENLEQMEASYDDYERFRAFDLAFHADRHEGVRQRGRADDRARDPPARRRDAAAGGRAPRASVLEQTAAEHRAIYDALAAGDGDARRRRGSPRTSNRPGPRGRIAQGVLDSG